MDAIVELAKMLRDRENIIPQGIGIGKVVSPPPGIKVMFHGLALDASWLVVPEHLMQNMTSEEATVADHGSHTHTVDCTLKVGDSVIVIPSIDNSKYSIIGKVG